MKEHMFLLKNINPISLILILHLEYYYYSNLQRFISKSFIMIYAIEPDLKGLYA